MSGSCRLAANLQDNPPPTKVRATSLYQLLLSAALPELSSLGAESPVCSLIAANNARWTSSNFHSNPTAPSL